MLTPVSSLGRRGKSAALTALLLAVVALPLAFSIAADLSETARTEQEYSQEVAGAVSAGLMRYLNRVWDAHADIAAGVLPAGSPLQPDSVVQALRSLQLGPAAIGTVWLDPTGRTVFSTLPDLAALSPAVRAGFDLITGGADGAVTDLFAPAGDPVVAVASGVRSAGRLGGVVVTVLNTARLGTELPIPAREAGSWLVVDRAGQIVYYSQDATLAAGPRQLPPDSPVHQALAGQTERFSRALADIDGTERIGAAVPVPEIGWAISASTPAAIRFGSVFRRAWLQAGAFAGAVAVGTALYRQRRRGLSTPARQVAAAADPVGALADYTRVLQEERERVMTISTLLLGTITRAGTWADLNPGWQRILGFPCEELQGANALNIVHPEDQTRVAELLRSLEEHVPSAEFECRVRCRDGSWKWILWSATANASRGATHLVGQNISGLKIANMEREHLLAREQAARAAAEEGQRRLAFLTEATTMLASSIDYHATLTNVAHLAVPHLADWCTVSLMTEHGPEQIAVAHRDPARAEWAAGRRFHPPRHAPSWKAIHTAKPVLMPDVTDGWLRQVSSSEEHYEYLRELGIRSVMIVPLLLRGQVVGLLGFHYAESGRRYGQADLSLAEELGARAAMAVDNALLYLDSQRTAARAEETIALLDTLLESAPVGFAFLDQSLRYVRVNDALATMNGLPTGEHLGRTIGEVLPDMALVLEPIFRRVIRTGEPVIAWEGVGPDPVKPGRRRHWLESVYPVRTADGKILGVGTIVTDITERKRMEEALRESELLLSGQKEILEMIATGRPLAEIQTAVVLFVEQQIRDSICAIVMSDTTGAIKFSASPNLPDEYRRAAEGHILETSSCLIAEVVRRRSSVIVPDVDRDPAWDSFRHIAHNHRIQSAWATPVLAANGEALGAFVVYHRSRREPRPKEQTLVEVFAHLTGIAVERQNAEEVRNRKLETLIDYTVEGVVAVDESERLIVANSAATRMLGLPPISGTPRLDAAGLPAQIVEILRHASRPDCFSPTRQTVSCGAVELDVHVSPVVAGLGRHYGAIALLQDVTAIAQFQRLQESFVANVSHELRAPLASLSAMAEAINDGVASEETRGRYLKAILSETERLRRLTNDILELSRLDAGVADITLVEFDIDLVLDTLQGNWELRCAAAKVHLEVGRPGIRVVADFDRVLQVLTNLVDNAVKFTPRDGRVTVDGTVAAGRLRISVSDTGPGIPLEHQPYVWQRFYMIDPARTRTPASGTGLGLPIARHLVEEMGGEVGIESKPGEGSTFWFTLPLA